MLDQNAPVADWFRSLTASCELKRRIGLLFEGCEMEVKSNNRRLLEKLAYYYKEFLAATIDPPICVTVVEAPLARIDVKLTPKPRPAGKQLKEEYVDLPDGRVVRKTRTGMLFVFGQDIHLGYGPCEENANQVVNFVNSRFIQQLINRGYLLCHAAGAADRGRGLAVAGFSGMGKSTLALHLVSRGLDFVSNDRVLVRRRAQGWEMLGAPKLPRVNPGTVLGNRSLLSVMPAELRQEAAALSEAELWRLEQKYDVFLDECFGPGRFRLKAGMAGLVVLNWRRDGAPLEIRTADLRERSDLSSAFRKSTGLFYEPEKGSPPPDLSSRAYLEALEGCPTFEIRGGADFAAAADACAAFLKTGEMPLRPRDVNAVP